MFVRNVFTSCFSVILVMLFCGVVDKNVDLAELLNGPFHRALAECFVTNVAGYEQTFAVLIFDQALRFLRVFVFFEVNDGEVRAFFCKMNGDGATDSAVPAGNERGFIAQFAAAHIIADARSGLRPHFVLATGLLPLMLRWELRFFGP
jgi:hypothetical protein